VSHHTFWSFFTMCSQICPLLCWSPQPVANQCLQQTCMTIVKLSSLHAPTAINFQLWRGRMGRMVLSPLFWSFFITVEPNLPNSELKHLATCQPKSAPNAHNQCQISIPTSCNCNLISTLTWWRELKGHHILCVGHFLPTSSTNCSLPQLFNQNPLQPNVVACS